MIFFSVKCFPKLCRCLQCKEIDIRSNGAAKVKVSHYLGTFKLVDGIYMDGRPVYKKDDGKFLNKDGKATFAIRSGKKLIDCWFLYHNWISLPRESFTDKEDDGHTAYIKSASGPICPFGDKVSHSERFGNGWKFWNGEEWEVDETLLSQCIKY